MSQFRNLVFEGGGVKGIAYAGALEFLDQKGDILPEIRRVAGTSAGAITAAILALGARSQEIKEIVGGTDFRKFMDDSFGLVRDTRRLLNSYGWY
ncbi:MAG TPA: patatin-like phospholipase family protein, partial [bacterium]|nr:patatin-like phospholipase family protein [bacterium]